jgi:2'-5' RNA ligase
MAETVKSLLEEIAPAFPPLRLELRGLGVFPHWKRPAVLWAGVRDRSHRLAELHAVLNRELSKLGVEAEDKPFRPHITLARFKEARNLAAIERLVHDHAGVRAASFLADRLTLFESRTHPDGAVHAPLSLHLLRGTPAQGKGSSDAAVNAA